MTNSLRTVQKKKESNTYINQLSIKLDLSEEIPLLIVQQFTTRRDISTCSLLSITLHKCHPSYRHKNGSTRTVFKKYTIDRVLTRHIARLQKRCPNLKTLYYNPKDIIITEYGGKFNIVGYWPKLNHISSSWCNDPAPACFTS
ncbi:unnamed protein product [Cunninghamella blakesleeana]